MAFTVRSVWDYVWQNALWEALSALVTYWLYSSGILLVTLAIIQRATTALEWPAILAFSLFITVFILLLFRLALDFRDRMPGLPSKTGTTGLLKSTTESPLRIEFEWNFFSSVQEGSGLDSGTRKIFYIYIVNSAPKDAIGVNVNVTKLAMIDTEDIIEKVHTALDTRRYPLQFKNTAAYEKNISPRNKERVDVVSYNTAFLDRHCRIETGAEGVKIYHPYNAYRLDIEVTASELPPRVESFDIVVDPQGEFRMAKAKKDL